METKTTLTVSKPKDRFDLEQELLGCWNITDELKITNESLLDGNLTLDELSNILMGLEKLYHLKFQKTFDTFENLISNDHLERKFSFDAGEESWFTIEDEM